MDSCRLSASTSARRETSVRRFRRSVRTWYPANSSDTSATLTINGNTSFRVVRNIDPLFRYQFLTKYAKRGQVRYVTEVSVENVACSPLPDYPDIAARSTRIHISCSPPGVN